MYNNSINNLKTVFPDIASEWNYEKNGDLLPEQVSPFSHKKVWWICPEGHEYEAPINSRTQNGTGCPVCSGKKILSGSNDLQSKFPEIAAEWDYEKNGNLKPCDVAPASHKKVWWKCKEEHSYCCTIANRTALNRGCPECANKAKRPVIVCIENGKVYKDSGEAGKDLGFHDSEGYISKCVKGKRTSAFGFHWRLATEEEKNSLK